MSVVSREVWMDFVVNGAVPDNEEVKKEMARQAPSISFSNPVRIKSTTEFARILKQVFPAYLEQIKTGMLDMNAQVEDLMRKWIANRMFSPAPTKVQLAWIRDMLTRDSYLSAETDDIVKLINRGAVFSTEFQKKILGFVTRKNQELQSYLLNENDDDARQYYAEKEMRRRRVMTTIAKIRANYPRPDEIPEEEPVMDKITGKRLEVAGEYVVIEYIPKFRRVIKDVEEAIVRIDGQIASLPKQRGPGPTIEGLMHRRYELDMKLNSAKAHQETAIRRYHAFLDAEKDLLRDQYVDETITRNNPREERRRSKNGKRERTREEESDLEAAKKVFVQNVKRVVQPAYTIPEEIAQSERAMKLRSTPVFKTGLTRVEEIQEASRQSIDGKQQPKTYVLPQDTGARRVTEVGVNSLSRFF